jgi:hypothetical protein
MKIEFHIDQINEILKYLDEVPHKYARGLVEFITSHVNKTVAEKQQSDVAEIQQSEDEQIKVELIQETVA